MKTLIMTVGLPRSGKSTWAQEQAKLHCLPIVCPDAIRLALHGQAYRAEAEPMVWALAKMMTRALFLAGHETVILDATNVSGKRRDEWIDTMWGRKYACFATSWENCVYRANKDGRPDLVPVIDRMWHELEMPPDADILAHVDCDMERASAR